MCRRGASRAHGDEPPETKGLPMVGLIQNDKAAFKGNGSRQCRDSSILPLASSKTLMKLSWIWSALFYSVFHPPRIYLLNNNPPLKDFIFHRFLDFHFPPSRIAANYPPIFFRLLSTAWVVETHRKGQHNQTIAEDGANTSQGSLSTWEKDQFTVGSTKLKAVGKFSDRDTDYWWWSGLDNVGRLKWPIWLF